MPENAQISGSSIRPANQRGAARLAAVQALYQMDVGRQTLEDTLSQFSAHMLGREVEGEQYLPADADFFRQIVTGVIKSQLDIDPTIDNALTDWPVGRIDATLRAILRAAAFDETGGDQCGQVLPDRVVGHAERLAQHFDAGALRRAEQGAQQFLAGRAELTQGAGGGHETLAGNCLAMPPESASASVSMCACIAFQVVASACMSPFMISPTCA